MQIARPYAQALFDLARGDKAVDKVEKGLEAVGRLADESEDFARFLRSPVISTDDKAAALEKVLKDAKVDGTVANFLRVIARNGRLFALPAIIKAFRALAATSRDEVSAEVTSAAPLSAAQLKTLAETLKAKVGKTVTLNEHVDPSLIGGLVVKVGSRMIDTSLRTRLNSLKFAMKEAG